MTYINIQTNFMEIVQNKNYIYFNTYMFSRDSQRDIMK